MAGTKRKSAPVKIAHVKESKKPRINSDLKPTTKKGKPLAVKKAQDLSGSDSDDSDSDGGVPVGYKNKASDEEDDDEKEEIDEDLPNANDGLHPERAKAVVVNSKYCKMC